MQSSRPIVSSTIGQHVPLNTVNVELDLHIIRYTIPDFRVEVWAFALQLQQRDDGVIVFAYDYPDKGGIVVSHMSLVDSKDVIRSIRKPLLETWDLLLLDCKGYREDQWETNVQWFLGAISALHTEQIMSSEKFQEWSARLRRPPVPARLELQMSRQHLQNACLSTVDRDDLLRIWVYLERCEVPTNNLKVVGQSVGALKKRPGPARLSTDRFWGADLTVQWHVHTFSQQPGEHYLKPTIGVGHQLARYLSDPKVNLRRLIKSLARTVKKPLLSIEGRTPVAVPKRSKLQGVTRPAASVQPRTCAPISKALARLQYRREIECKAETSISPQDFAISLQSDKDLSRASAPATLCIRSRLYQPSLIAGRLARMTISDKMMENLTKDFNTHTVIRENKEEGRGDDEEEDDDDDDDNDEDEDEEVSCSGVFQGFIRTHSVSQAGSNKRRPLQALVPRQGPAVAVPQQKMQRHSSAKTRLPDSWPEQLALVNPVAGTERTLPQQSTALSVSPIRQGEASRIKKRTSRGTSNRPPRPPR